MAFLLETFTGIHALRVFLFSEKVREEWEEIPGLPRPKKSRLPLILDSLVHLVLVLCLLIAGRGLRRWHGLSRGHIFCILRYVAPDSRTSRGGRRIGRKLLPKFPTAPDRLFGDDFFSCTFGGAGFNRHLLHHWEPQISYTC